MTPTVRNVLFAAIAMLAAVDIDASLDRGEIRGTVTDSQGAVVPGVQVVVTNTATNVATKLTTNEAGFYLAQELVPGTYTVQIRAQGFQTLDVRNVVVKAGTTITEDGRLQVGRLAETVLVSSEAPLVDTS